MAIVNGPLFSLDASGAIGKAIVYTKWKGRNVVREYVTPANPNTIPQRARRQMVAILNIFWKQATLAEQNSWLDIAVARSISTFNAFTSYNLDQMTNGDPVTVDRDATPSTPTAVDILTGTGGVNRIDIEIVGLAISPSQRFAISMTLGTTPPVAGLSQIVATAPVSTTPQFVSITGIPAGTYSLRAFTLTDDGAYSLTGVTETSIVVTGL